MVFTQINDKIRGWAGAVAFKWGWLGSKRSSSRSKTNIGVVVSGVGGELLFASCDCILSFKGTRPMIKKNSSHHMAIWTTTPNSNMFVASGMCGMVLFGGYYKAQLNGWGQVRLENAIFMIKKGFSVPWC